MGLYVCVVSYLRAARYLAVRRPDMGTRAQLGVYALSPLVSVLYLVLLTPLRYFAATGLRTSHRRTRATVEPVEIDADGTPLAVGLKAR